MRRIATAVAITRLIVPTLHAQSPLVSSRITVTGRVLADDSGEPVPNARVILSATTGSSVVVLTDIEGRFTLTAATGPQRIEVSKTRFATESVPLKTTDTGLEVRLRRAATLSGRVIDALGQPVVDARIVIEQPGSGQPGAAKTLKATDTDDRGEYRIGGLSAGDVLVAVLTVNANATARVASGRVEFEANPRKTYFPGTGSLANATPVHVNAGEDRASVDLVVDGDQSGGPSFGMYSAVDVMIPDHPSVDPATVGGQVVDAGGRGLPFAFVRLFPANQPFAMRAIRADTDGHFEFADLAGGAFRVAVFQPGYTMSAGTVAEFPMPILGTSMAVTLEPGQTRDNVTVAMTRLGVLAGRVVDELGDPVEGAGVQLLTVKYQGGRRRLVDAGFGVRLTNDLGEYRLHDIPPGRYLVSVSIGAVGSADVPGYTRTYFPGTPTPADAQFVALDQRDRFDVDIALARTRTALVSGHIYGAHGDPSMGGHVELRPTARSGQGAVSLPVGARLSPNGAFAFPNVPPGEYVIEADRGKSSASAEGEFGTTIVTVGDANVTNVIVQMSAGSSVVGRVVLETDDPTKPPDRVPIRVAATGVDPDRTPSKVAEATVNPDGTFAMTGLNGPRRLDLTSVPPGWMLKEMRVHGVEVTDRPLTFGRPDQSLTDVEVVLTDRLTRLSGSIAFESGRQPLTAHVIVFSADRDRWYPSSRFQRQTLVAPGGVFVVTALPPGTYYAAVVARLPADSGEAWQDPEYLETLISSAKGLTISDGEQQALNLRLASQ